MEEKDIKKLLEYLAEKGFESRELESSLRSKIKTGLPEFSLEHTIHFSHMEDQTVMYRLQFQKNQQINAYLFHRYESNLVILPEIPNRQYGAINSQELDRKMQKVHWGLYFRGGAVQGVDNTGMAKECLPLLNQLLTEKGSDEAVFARTLMFKYWPKDQLNPEWAGAMERMYQRKRDFTSSVHANLAYYLLTGKLDDLYEKCDPIGLTSFRGYHFYNRLCEKLVSNPSSFQMDVEKFCKDGIGEIRLYIDQVGNNYKPEQLIVSFRKFPPIEHRTFAGIDTKILDIEMSSIDWSKDSELFIFEDGDVPDFTPPVEMISKKMNNLLSYPDGQKIYDMLSLKYWVGATFFEDMVRDEAWELAKSFPEIKMPFPSNTNAHVAINLLAGRAAMATELFRNYEGTEQWARLKQGDQYGPKLHFFIGPTSNDLVNLIDNFRFFRRPENLALELSKGDICQEIHPSGRKILMMCVPEEKTLAFFAEDSRPIPVNINFDPDWHPPSYTLDQSSKIVQPQVQKKLTQRKSDNRKPGSL